MQVEKGKVHAPEIGQMWMNSAPLALRELRGRVVLVDFWDYTCVNCIRTLPYVAEWHRRYRELGLTVVGVHAPEFTFARSQDLVQEAMRRFGIEYPVVLDNDYLIWQAFANKCWPAKYLIDKDGYIRFFHFGEGDYQGTELAIQSLLREVNPALEFPAPMEPLRDTDRPGAACYRTTPELYLGFRRGRLGNAGGFQDLPSDPQTASPGEYRPAANYALPERLEADVFYLNGAWEAGPESVRAAARDASVPAGLLVYYTAKEVNLVMAPGDRRRVVEILQDGRPIAVEDAGDDARFTDTGEGYVTVDTPRMYNLVKNAEMGQHLLQLVSREAGLECFAFTFVSCAAGRSAPARG
jgi:thiol-disulfide isomerase/thioredoxin